MAAPVSVDSGNDMEDAQQFDPQELEATISEMLHSLTHDSAPDSAATDFWRFTRDIAAVIQSGSFQYPHIRYWLETALPSFALICFKRANFDDSCAEAVHETFVNIITIATTLIKRVDMLPLADALSKILLVSKTYPFYKLSYQVDEEEEEDDEDDEFFAREKTTPWHREALAAFIKCKGFESIIERLKSKETPIPLPLLKCYLLVCRRVITYMSPDNEYPPRMAQALLPLILDRMKAISDDEIKAVFDDRLLNFHESFLGVWSFIAEYLPEDQIAFGNDLPRLELANRLMRCQFLDKRLAGLTEIRGACKWAHEVAGRTARVNNQDPFPWKTQNPKQILDFIRSREVVTYLFGPNFHPELAKRAGDILNFIGYMTPGALPETFVDLLWDCQVNKHESISHIVWGLFTEIAVSMSSRALPHLLSKLEQIPLSEYSVPLVNLLCDVGTALCWYWEDVQNDVPGTNTIVPILWSALCSSQLSPELNSKCFESLCRVLSQRDTVFRERIEAATYAVEALRQHSNHVTLANHLLLKICDYTNADDNSTANAEEDAQRKMPAARAHLLSFLFQEHKIDQLCFADIIHYFQTCMTPTVDPMMRAASAVQARERLDVFAAFLRYGQIVMEETHLEHIWNKLVQPSAPDARDIVLKWLHDISSTSNGPQQLTPLFDSTMSSWFFNKFISHMSFEAVSEVGFKAFEHFLRASASAFEKQTRAEVEHQQDTESKEFPGMEVLWRFCLECEHPTVSQQAITNLVRLYAVPVTRVDGKAVTGPEVLLHKTMSRLNSYASQVASSPNNGRAVTRCIMTLQKLLADLNTFSTAAVSGAAASSGRPIKIHAQIVGKPKVEVTILSGDSIWNVKTKISVACGEVPQMLRLIFAGKELKADEATIETCVSDLRDGIVIHATRRPTVVNPPTPNPQASADGKSRLSITDGESESLSSVLSEVYFSDLFSLLALPGKLGEQVWDLLMKLPTNKTQLQHLRALDTVESGSAEGWQALFDLNSTFKLFYSLQIVDSLLHNAGDQAAREEWSAKFLSRGGVRFLLQALLHVDFLNESKGSKRIPCLALLVRILTEFCVASSSPATPEKPASPTRLRDNILQESSVDVTALVSRLLDILHACSSGGANFGLDDVSPPDSASAPSSDAAAPAPLTPGEQLALSLLGFFAAAVISTNLFSIFADKSISKWFEASLLLTYSEKIKEATRAYMGAIVDFTSPAASSAISASSLEVLLRLLPDIPPVPTVSPLQFLYLTAYLIRKNPSASNLDQLSNLLVERITSHPIVELRGVPFQDTYLQGILEVLHSVIEVSPAHKLSSGGRTGGLVEWLFHHGLFAIATPENNGPNCPPLCKARETRATAFKVLFEYSRGCDQTSELLFGCLNELLRTRERPLKVWQYAPGFIEKASSGLVGLKNLGATCYMNSLTQQFYMIPQFRAGLLRAEEAKPENPEDPQDSLLVQMQAIMANLQESERRYYDTTPFCKVYKPSGNQPMNPGVQMDVDEFFLSLFDRLEKSTKGTAHEKILKEFFGGQFAQQIVSRECEHVSERDEDFFNLSVEVKGKRKLEECLDLFVKGDLLDGDNKYFCDKCNKRVDALKRCCLKSLPNNLFIHLKRFDFDFELLRRSKINDYVEFPEVLNLEAYTREGLSRREHSEPPASQDELKDYEYQLTGVIVHSGTVDSGHYYSFIKDRSVPDQNKWYLFNDTQVEPFDPADIPGNCFGGYDHSSYGAGRGNRSVPKHYSAYMLVYSKVKPSIPEVNSPLSRQDLAQAVPNSLYEQTWRDNYDFLTDKCLFDPDFFHFVTSVVGAQLPVTDTGYSNDMRVGKRPTFDRACAATELAFRFFVEVLVHAKDKEPRLTDVLNGLQTLLLGSTTAAQWFLHHLCRSGFAWVHKMLFDCPIVTVREKFAFFIQLAIAKLAQTERSMYEETLMDDVADSDDRLRDKDLESARHEERKRRFLEIRARTQQMAKPQDPNAGSDDEFQGLRPDVQLKIDFSVVPKSHIIEFMDHLLSMMPEIHLFYRQFAEYFRIIEFFCSAGSLERKYLLQRNAIVAMLELYLGPESPNFPGPKRDSMPGNLESLALSNMKHAVGAVSVFVRSCKTPLQMENPDAPSSPFACADPLMDLPADILALLSSPASLARLVEDQSHPEAVAFILAHFCFENEKMSQAILSCLLEEAKLLRASGLTSVLSAMSSILAIKDSLSDMRLKFVAEQLIPITVEQLKFRAVLLVFLKFLIDLAEESSVVCDIIFQHRELWVKPLLFFSNESVRTLTEQLILTLCSTDKGFYDTGYEKVLLNDKAFAFDAESNKARVAKRAALLAQISDTATRSERSSQFFMELMSMIPEAKAAAHIEVARDTVQQGAQSWGRLLHWLMQEPSQKSHVVALWPNLLEFLAWCEASKNQIPLDFSKNQLLLFIDKAMEDNPEMVRAVAASIADPALKDMMTSVINYAFWTDANAATVSFNNINIPCYIRVMSRASEVSKEFMQMCSGSRVWMWLIKWILIAENEMDAAADALLAYAELVAKADEHWRKGQIIGSVPLVQASTRSPKVIGRSVRLFNTLLLQQEDFFVLSEHKGLSWILDFIAKSLTPTMPRDIEPSVLDAVKLLQNTMSSWLIAAETGSEAVRERVAAFRTNIMQPSFIAAHVVASIISYLLHAIQTSSPAPLAFVLFGLVQSLVAFEPSRLPEDSILGLRRYFNRQVLGVIAPNPAADDKMDVDVTDSVNSLKAFQRDIARFVCIQVAEALKHRIPIAREDNESTAFPDGLFEPVAAFLTTVAFQHCECADVESTFEAVLLFFVPESTRAGRTDGGVKLAEALLFEASSFAQTTSGKLVLSCLVRSIAGSEKSESLVTLLKTRVADAAAQAEVDPSMETLERMVKCFSALDVLFQQDEKLCLECLHSVSIASVRAVAALRNVVGDAPELKSIETLLSRTQE